MSADPTNGQSNIDVILKAMAPDRREAFVRCRNRPNQFKAFAYQGSINTRADSKLKIANIFSFTMS